MRAADLIILRQSVCCFVKEFSANNEQLIVNNEQRRRAVNSICNRFRLIQICLVSALDSRFQ